ncbi:amino acid adenylation domain-containing protein [Oscillatoria sp. CS-180]|uniref:non-ribosomal peptide synthetase n=1 Tax=Oscillatoria sp. CS-180 TaxID=3021720 RepID=UPI00232F2D4D|nr:non-ribosomal peptide synthetase [Oscillatoria sp. CS-180]MDB9527422.1 amino acid adenylation domain-containing protein [Oscillatoria sp. CS-180]
MPSVKGDIGESSGNGLSDAETGVMVDSAHLKQQAIAQKLADLPVQKRSVFLKRLQQAGIDLATLPILPVDRQKTALPLSFSQQRLWFLDQLSTGTTYNESLALTIGGDLQISLLHRSLMAVAQRHEILRTNFKSVKGSPMQVIAPHAIVPLSVIDLQGLADPVKSSQMQRLVAAEVDRPFDLSCDPLLRVLLIKLEAELHVLVLATHHIVSDGWSTGILVREVKYFYGALLSGRSSPLPELKIQYADFAYWQQQWLQEERLKSHLHYWQQQLAGAPPLLTLPTDHPRPAVQKLRGAWHAFALPKELTDRLKVLGQRSEATLFMTLLAAFAVLLSRYSRQTDLVIGAPIANRNRPELESLIGVFVNTLALRIDLQGNPEFQTLLSRVREVALAAYAHQDVPFEQVVEALRPERSLDHAPLFQVALTLQNTPMGQLESPGLSFAPLETPNIHTRFDLVLLMHETETALSGVWEYDRDLFEASTIQRMADHFQSLLEAIVAQPTQLISDLPFLSTSERQQLLVAWNDTTVKTPSPQYLHQRLEAQAERTPDAVALVFENQQLTYQALNEAANQLAHCLQRRGVGPEVLVGLCVERSLAMVVGLLGILKAGGAYVPLDPDYPSDRLAFILADTQLSIVVTHQSTAPKLPPSAAQFVCLDDDWATISRYRRSNPNLPIRASHLAYVIYTSGSTGTPKGVLLTHQGLSNLAIAQQHSFDLTPQSCILQFASLNFDASIWEIAMALCSGAKLCIGTADSLLPGATLRRQLQQHSITHVTLPPSALAVMPTEPLPTLKTLIVAGEACSSKLATQWSSNRHFFNAYGPTESTVCATVAEVIDGERPLTIGQAIANTQIYILDSYLNPVPVGVPGELYIGGEGLARGYLNRPALTADRFIPNPFSVELGHRLYRTGDLACYQPEGNIKFLGRVDDQAKIRGFRIEPGEIEAWLHRDPQVQESVVVCSKDLAGHQRLVAYVASASSPPPTPATLRRFLKQHLPDYMVPSAFVTLAALPKMPNGKVDRAALPVPETETLMRSAKYEAPRSDVEQTLANIWSQVLGIAEISIHDNFFELGGHSLLATQVISQILSTLAVDVPLRHLFESPTIAELSDLMATLQPQAIAQVAPILPISREQRLGLSFAQERLWLIDQLEGASPAYNISTGIRLAGTLSVVALEQAVTALVQRHEVLRTHFQVVEGVPVQVIVPNLPKVLSQVDLQLLPPAAQSSAVEKLLAEDAQRPFALSQGPLFRLTLLRLTHTEHVLLMTLHHIIADAWSMGILMHEVSTLFHQCCQGESPMLPPLPFQYADFAHWQRKWLSGERLEQQLAYWRQQLAAAPPLLELPTDSPRPVSQTFSGRTHQMCLPLDLTEAIEAIAQQTGTTLFMALLAAYAVLLSRYSRQSDLVIGTPIANRNRKDLESLIGFFVNTLALRVDTSGNPSFTTLLQRVQTVALEAYAHQDLPFEKLVDALQPERSLSHSPLFQVMLVLQNTPPAALELPGLQLNYLAAPSNTTKFDITLTCYRSDVGLVTSWEYNCDLFTGDTIDRMARQFATLLQNGVAFPEQPVNELPLLGAEEQHQLLEEWSGLAAHEDLETLTSLFAAQADRTPDAIALEFEAQQLSYQELNRRSNQLAHWLQQHHRVKSEVRVGLYLERSPEVIIAMLAILKAGGVYVPLDPDYPPERLRYLIQDANVSLVMTHTAFREKLPKDTVHLCLEVETAISQAPETSPPCTLTSEHLAYLMYTSGSTGQPKGVCVPHRGVVRLAVDPNYVDLNARDIVLQFAPIAFDASTFEIWGALLNGSRLVIMPPGLPSLAALAEVLQRQQITLLWLTAGLFHLMVDQQLESLQSLRYLIAGGDVLSVRHLQRSQPHLSGHLINGYGPTENTTFTCCYDITDAQTLQSSVPIGTPIRQTQVYVLDTSLQPVPIGVPGELYVGGQGLARGYHQQPALTAAAFVPHPFTSRPGARLYRTGDVARYRSDGCLEFLGRLDRQVKLNGFRIELGEIEAALSQHPQVQNALVMPIESASGAPALVAYGVVDLEHPPTVAELRTFLKTKLPEHMVPAAIALLETFPLTANGKVDRQQLPRPDYPEASTAAFVAPTSPIERSLQEIWQQVLGRERISVYDNFFELGGDSILTLQMVARARQMGLSVTPKHVFQYQTIAELSTVVGIVSASIAEQGPVTGPLPLTPIQDWFFKLDLPEPQYFNQALLLQLPPDIQPHWLEEALLRLLKHHDALRLRFTQAAEGWQAAIAPPENETVLTVLDLGHLPPSQQSGAITAAAHRFQKSLDIGQGPLIRLALIRLRAGQPARLLAVSHHLVIDGVSWRILIEDLAFAYTQLEQAQPLHLPPKTTSLQQWATYLQTYAHSEAVLQEIPYWQQQHPSKALPVDLPETPDINTEQFSAQVSVQLSEPLTQALLQHVPAAYHTQINDVLLTALTQSLAAWTQTRSALIALESHGREDLTDGIDLSRTVGWFTSLFPICLSLEDTDDLGAALRSIKEQLRQIPHRGMGYGLLRQHHPDRLPSISPQINFNYLGQLEQVSAPDDWGLATESSGPSQSPLGQRPYLLSVSGYIVAHQLQLNWNYSRAIHEQTTIQQLADRYLHALENLIHHCLSAEAGGYTPSDFPLAGLNEQSLQQLSSLMAEADSPAPTPDPTATSSFSEWPVSLSNDAE